MIKIDYKDADNLSEALDNLYTIITLLRSPEGCPWDRIQTNKTATQSLIDESYEYLDGVIKGNVDSEREEIGDVMINVFMNLRLHEEQNDFKPYEAINEVCQKLIRRHPHVFGDEHTDNVEGVLTLWNKVKENVEGHKEKSEDFFEHIPSSLPPLEASYEIQKKLKKVGFDWNDANGVIDKEYEELQEVKEAIAENNPQLQIFDLSEGNNQDHIEEEIGDLLFTVVNLSRFLKVRPNVALYRCNDKVKTRFQKLFDAAREKGIPLDKDHVDEMNQLWDEIKRDEKND